MKRKGEKWVCAKGLLIKRMAKEIAQIGWLVSQGDEGWQFWECVKRSSKDTSGAGLTRPSFVGNVAKEVAWAAPGGPYRPLDFFRAGGKDVKILSRRVTWFDFGDHVENRLGRAEAERMCGGHCSILTVDIREEGKMCYTLCQKSQWDVLTDQLWSPRIFFFCLRKQKNGAYKNIDGI